MMSIFYTYSSFCTFQNDKNLLVVRLFYLSLHQFKHKFLKFIISFKIITATLPNKTKKYQMEMKIIQTF